MAEFSASRQGHCKKLLSLGCVFRPTGFANPHLCPGGREGLTLIDTLGTGGNAQSAQPVQGT